jgi:hypothetical protein
MSTSDELRAQAAALLAKAAEIETPLTQADVTRMYKAREYDAITQARQDGRLDALLNPPTTEGI